ncbi:hypothetical protein Goshw_028947 [Gossypium schwendimanii]|uniref:Protein kinase domain-containing protein n=1 Tax=Gossypium schwendimanii TaxID=34291 RepID=A0A7J9MKR0_GOSSC|nr:hypothetical protein [Gossypium schwendimanii]
MIDLRGTPTYNGRYVSYNILGNIFEVSSNCATNSKTKEEVQIKKIGNAFNNRIDAKRTLYEIKLLCHMDHDNVIYKILNSHC